jgi:hypothetical protein
MMLRNYRLYKIAFKVEYRTWHRDDDGSAYGDPFWARSPDIDKNANEHRSIVAPNKGIAVGTLAQEYILDSYRGFEVVNVTEEKIDYLVEVHSH